MKATLSCCALALLAGASLQAYAESPDQTAAEPPAAEAASADAMRAYVDPETGTLTSTPPANMPRTPGFPERQMDLIQKIDHPNGMTEWRFNGQANEVMMAKVEADGKVATWCEEHGAEHVHETTLKTETRDHE